MTAFARIKCDAYEACGVFDDGAAGLSLLVDGAEVVVGYDYKPESVAMIYKPTDSMTEQDMADAGAMVVGAVVVLNAY